MNHKPMSSVRRWIWIICIAAPLLGTAAMLMSNEGWLALVEFRLSDEYGQVDQLYQRRLDASGSEALFAYALSEGSPRVRATALEIMDYRWSQWARSEMLMPRVSKLQNDMNITVRTHAQLLLIRAGESPMSELHEMVNDENWQVAEEAILAVGRWRLPELAPDLAGIALSDADLKRRSRAISALAQLGWKHLQRLESVVHSLPDRCRSRFAYEATILCSKHEDAVPIVLELAQDICEDVRQAVVVNGFHAFKQDDAAKLRRIFANDPADKLRKDAEINWASKYSDKSAAVQASSKDTP